MNIERYRNDIKSFYALGRVHALEAAVFAARHMTRDQLEARLQEMLNQAKSESGTIEEIVA